MNATFVETNPFLANGGDPKDPPQGIYYQDVGIQTIEDEFGLKTQVKFDLYVVNTTEYVPNRWFRSGRSASGANRNASADADAEDLHSYDTLIPRDIEAHEYLRGIFFSSRLSSVSLRLLEL
eukprot:4957589-Pleurochrysis_carterae.AAC.1